MHEPSLIPLNKMSKKWIPTKLHSMRLRWRKANEITSHQLNPAPKKARSSISHTLSLQPLSYG